MSQLDLSSDLPKLLAELGFFLTRIGLFAEASLMGRGLTELRPASSQGPMLQGYVAFAVGRLPEAEKHYRAALAKAPDDNTVRAFLGETLLAQRRTREGEDLLGKAAAGNDAGARLAKELLDGSRQGLFAAR